MIRSRSSAAALRVNVIARMCSGSTPAASRLTYRSTSTLVFPVPADASSTTFFEGSTACLRAVLSNVSDIILSADRRKAARLAAKDVVRGGRKFAALDGVDGITEPLLSRFQHVCPVLVRGK